MFQTPSKKKSKIRNCKMIDFYAAQIKVKVEENDKK
jgi:hypothetical protein